VITLQARFKEEFPEQYLRLRRDPALPDFTPPVFATITLCIMFIFFKA